MQNNNQSKLSFLLNMLTSNEGSSKEELAGKMMKSLSSDENRELNELLKDKERLGSILSSPAAQELMKKINGGQNGQHQ